MRSLRALVLATGLAGGLAAGALAEALLLEDPGPHRQALLAYLGGSLAPLTAAPDRLTAERRLAQPPFLVEGGRRALDLDPLPAAVAEDLRQAASPAGATGILLFEALKDRAASLYPGVRAIPERVEEILQGRGVLEDTRFRTVELDSLIARGPRRIRYDLEEVLAPLAGDSPRPRYTPGTLLVAEELDEAGTLLETHVMRKREDQEWDFALFREDGRRAELGRNGPAFRAPVTCFTCHQATGRVAPFADFPDPSREIRGHTPAVRLTLTPEEEELYRQGLLAEPEADQVHGKYRAVALVELRRLLAAPGTPDWARALGDRLASRFPLLR